MKKIIAISLVLVFTLAFVEGSFAQTVTSRPKLPLTGPGMARESTPAAGLNSENLNARANQEIARRIQALNEVLTKLNGLKRLNTTQKSALTTQIQAEIASLTALQTKIAADTDPATLKADVQSIVTSYRIFLFFIPQIRLMAAGEALGNAVDTFNTIGETLENRITLAKNQGKDVTQLTNLLVNMKEKVSDASVKSQTITTSVSALNVQGYPGNKTTLENARNLVKMGRSDLQEARQIALQIIQGLVSATGTSSAASVQQATPSAMNERMLKTNSAVRSTKPTGSLSPTAMPAAAQ